MTTLRAWLRTQRSFALDVLDGLEHFRTAGAVAGPALVFAAVGAAAAGVLQAPVFGLLVRSVRDALASGMTDADRSSLTWSLVAFAAVAVGAQVCSGVQEVAQLAAARNIDGAWRQSLDRLLATPAGVEWFDDPAIANEVRVAAEGISGNTAGQAAVGIVTSAARHIGGIAAATIVATYSPILAVALFAAVMFYGYTRRYIARGLSDRLLANFEATRQSAYIADLLYQPGAAKEVRLFGLSRWLVSRFDADWADGMSGFWDTRMWVRRRSRWMYLFYAAAFGTTLWYIGDGAIDGRISIPTMVVLVRATYAVAAAGGLGNYYAVHWGRNAFSARRSLEARLPEAPPEPEASPSDGELRFERVTFTYPNAETTVLRDFDLTIPHGQSLAIVGLNGAGKTTLIRLLARLYEPTSGRVTVGGVDIRMLSPRAWRQRLAVIFQDFVRFELSASDNVTAGAEIDVAARDRAAERAGATGLVARLPSSWETVLTPDHPGGVSLSGGEWQRIALARALYAVERGASVLVLDEPTASLDVRAEAELFERFLDITAGLTSIIVSHRFSTVRLADRIVVIGSGGIVEDGSHEELMAADGEYATLYRLQAERFSSAVDDA